MTPARLQHFQQLLEQRQSELHVHSQSSSDARKSVELDQQSVGRLSRQDALQQQAMAKAQDARRVDELRRIHLALQRLSKGDFGFCEDCGEAINPRRLEIDPTTVRCVDCAR